MAGWIPSSGTCRVALARGRSGCCRARAVACAHNWASGFAVCLAVSPPAVSRRGHGTSFCMSRVKGTNARRALVTGGAGFIGSHLVDALVARGDRVLAIDDLSRGTRENLSGAMELDAEINHAGTVKVLEAARAAGVGRFVFASTGGALYGDARTLPTPESAPLAPLSPYGANKLAAEGEVRRFHR